MVSHSDKLDEEMDDTLYADCIFRQTWWLDAVAPGRWGAAEVSVAGKLQGCMPYVMKSGPFGLKLISRPQLTPYLGPWVADGNAKYPKQLSQQKQILDALIDQLPPYDYFSHNFHYSFKNWMPFHWRGFTSATYFTYVINDLTDIDLIWRGFLDNVKTDAHGVLTTPFPSGARVPLKGHSEK